MAAVRLRLLHSAQSFTLVYTVGINMWVLWTRDLLSKGCWQLACCSESFFLEGWLVHTITIFYKPAG